METDFAIIDRIIRMTARADKISLRFTIVSTLPGVDFFEGQESDQIDIIYCNGELDGNKLPCNLPSPMMVFSPEDFWTNTSDNNCLATGARKRSEGRPFTLHDAFSISIGPGLNMTEKKTTTMATELVQRYREGMSALALAFGLEMYPELLNPEAIGEADEKDEAGNEKAEDEAWCELLFPGAEFDLRAPPTPPTSLPGSPEPWVIDDIVNRCESPAVAEAGLLGERRKRDDGDDGEEHRPDKRAKVEDDRWETWSVAVGLGYPVACVA
ncbi:hypothetical protein [Rhizobium terrae]|uniref:hypothetical protein n=1 Tax=Rhizobium terrae TaxID=2171756 RepID=UPI000E3CDA9C|nr:hypothetical protein [Rhizobium terrae]